jgi:hypothetical protein
MNVASSSVTRAFVFAATTFALALTASTNAQVQTDTTTTKGTPTKNVEVEHGQVVLVQGNDLIIKMDNGTIRHFPNVPDSTKFTVDGQALTVHDLKPGMNLQRTITTTSTPETVKTVKTVTGTVFYVNAPNSVILTLADGKNQSFKIPKNQQFNIDGQMVDAFGLRKGMKITATKIEETPEVVVTEHRSITGTMPEATPAPATKAVAAAPPPPPPDVPILVAVLVPVSGPTTLPKTASELPLVGLVGLLFFCTSFALKLVRFGAAK